MFNTIKKNVRTLMYGLSLGGVVGISVGMSLMVIASWWGGKDGTVIATFNTAHERLLETILFPTLSVSAFLIAFKLLKKEIK